jgi:hypothetical protein
MERPGGDEYVLDTPAMPSDPAFRSGYVDVSCTEP